MDGRQLRFLAGAAIAVGVLSFTWATPVAAATCGLTAPATIVVGTPFAIEGAGFPANSAIDIKLAILGGGSDEFSVQSDTGGSFRIDSTPETADIGKTTAVATAGSTCTARVTYSVVATAPTTPPSPAATAAGQAAPRTDTLPGTGHGGAATGAAWTLAILMIAVGCVGLLATRRPDRR
jgi:hypothetical protein